MGFWIKTALAFRWNGEALSNRKRKMQVRAKGKLQLDGSGLGW